MATAPEATYELTVPVDRGQILLMDPAGSGPAAVEAALEDALDSGRHVGAARGAVAVVTPVADTYGTPVTVEVWAGEAPDDSGEWDHEVDLDLDVHSGRLAVDTATDAVAEVAVPPGRYRIRVSSRGFVAVNASAAASTDGAYRIRAWPRGTDRPPVTRRQWAGWR